MSTTVKVISATGPVRVTELDVVIVKGPSTLHETYSTKQTVLDRGQEATFYLRGPRVIQIEEIASDNEVGDRATE